MKKVLASIVLSLFLLHADAQDRNIRQKAIGVSFILNDFVTAQRIRSTSITSVMRNDNFGKFKEMSPGLGLTYFKGLTPHIDFAGTLNMSFLRYPYPNKPAALGDALLLEADASVNLKMFTEDYLFTPYLIVGIGASQYKSKYGAFIPLGGGLKLNLYDEASLFITTQYRVPVTAENINYHFVHSLGVAGIIGRKREPAPPPPPPPPADRDLDGIVDAVDQCPDTPGVAKYNGCPVPDTDKDGINDDEDQCVTVPGLAKYRGCPIPDTDSDGINDEEDRCPTVAGVARYQGCPVPDTDGDGVNDEDDKCPTLPGTAANQGCPEIKEEIIERVNYAAQNIFFATGSARLLNTSNKALNEIAKIMKEDTNLKLDIDGHTDNVGSETSNHTLSHNRANSVKAYLVKQGVDESRLVAQGFGESRPIADNKTATGRAKNRRVEMKLHYQ
jgi:outer membrane protein OmpA-like peptidoglycan-associated protein